MKKLLLILLLALSCSGVWAQTINWKTDVNWARVDVGNTLNQFREAQQANAEREKLSLPIPYPSYVKFKEFAAQNTYDRHGGLQQNRTFNDIGNHKVGSIRFPMWQVASRFWEHHELEVLAVYLLVGSLYHHDDELRQSIYIRILGETQGKQAYTNEDAFFAQFWQTLDGLYAEHQSK